MNDFENNNYPNIRQSFGIAGIFILAELLMIPYYRLIDKFISTEASQLIYYLLSAGITFLIVYSIRKHYTDNTTFNFEIKNKRVIPLVIIAATALMVGIIAPLVYLLPSPESFVESLHDSESKSGIFFTFLFMVIAAPIFEELIFRGIMLDGLLKKYSPVKSILVSSFLFGFVHLNPWQFVMGLFLGGFTGWIYYKTECVSLTIIIHASINLMGVLSRNFGDSDSSYMNESLVESFGGTLNFVLAVICFVSIFLTAIYFLRREFDKFY